MRLLYAIPLGFVLSWLIAFAIGLLPLNVTMALKPIMGYLNALDSIKFFLMLLLLVSLARKWLRA